MEDGEIERQTEADRVRDHKVGRRDRRGVVVGLQSVIGRLGASDTVGKDLAIFHIETASATATRDLTHNQNRTAVHASPEADRTTDKTARIWSGSGRHEWFRSQMAP